MLGALVASFESLFPVSSMSQNTHIELETKDCIFLVKSLFIQFTPQLFPAVSIRNKVRYTSRPTVTSKNHHQTKYEFNNPKGKKSFT